MMMKQSYLLGLILLLAVIAMTFSSCTQNEVIENAPPEAVPVTPIDILTPNENLVMKFYAWDDGSAGVMEESDGSISYSFDEKLENATPAEIYWACSKPGKEVPAMLVAHHNDVSASEGTAAFAEFTARKKQGWALEQGVVRGSPCLNSTFRSKHCNLANYPHGGACHTNTTSSKHFESNSARRFKAGFCLQDGRAIDVLSYEIECQASNYHLVWGDYLNPYVADVYRTWTWIAGTFTQSRRWDHRSIAYSDAVYDWACASYEWSICAP